MSETTSPEWIGVTLRAIQAEQRNARAENALIRAALTEAITVLLQRIGNFETLIDVRLDTLNGRFDDMGGRLDRIEAAIARLGGAP